MVRFSNVRLKGLGHAILGNFTKFNFVNYELQNFSVLFSFMTVFAVETRGFSNTSGRLERRHKEENSMLTWAVLQCKTRLQQFFFKFATQPSSHRTVFSRTDSFKKVQKSTFFYKALPLTLANSEHHLGALNLSLEDYKANV